MTKVIAHPRRYDLSIVMYNGMQADALDEGGHPHQRPLTPLMSHVYRIM